MYSEYVHACMVCVEYVVLHACIQCTCTCIYTWTHSQVYMQSIPPPHKSHTCTFMQVCMIVWICTHNNTWTHTYGHTHMHTHTPNLSATPAFLGQECFQARTDPLRLLASEFYVSVHSVSVSSTRPYKPKGTQCVKGIQVHVHVYIPVHVHACTLHSICTCTTEVHVCTNKHGYVQCTCTLCTLYMYV